MKPAIFISYRRSDAGGYAFALWDRLRRAFGDEAVFYDRDDRHHLPSGCDWEQRIFAAIDNARACVVTIGPEWIGACDALGQRRLDHDEDVVRKEVSRALGHAEKECIHIFPALFGKADMPGKEMLPADLQGLPRWNARAYRMDRDTDAAFERLIDELDACPGIDRVLMRRELPLLNNLIKHCVAAGVLPPDLADLLKNTALADLKLPVVGNEEV